MSDPAAMRYWSTPPHTTLDETRQFLDQMIAAPTSESDDFLIEYRGEVIGGRDRVPSRGVGAVLLGSVGCVSGCRDGRQLGEGIIA